MNYYYHHHHSLSFIITPNYIITSLLAVIECKTVITRSSTYHTRLLHGAVMRILSWFSAGFSRVWESTAATLPQFRRLWSLYVKECRHK